MRKIDVVVIEDDFRIARIHKEMIEQHPEFRVVQCCLTAKEALTYLREAEKLPSIILLDMFIPDVEGYDLLEAIKGKYPYISIIIASAAVDVETIQRSKMIGVFDYMIKPIEQARLQSAFDSYSKIISLEQDAMNQMEIDAIFSNGRIGKTVTNAGEDILLPKGIDILTLDKIKAFLISYDKTEITAQALGEIIGISRSTARRYLEYLGRLEIVTATLHYGQVGRPQRIYKIREQYEQN